MLENLIQQIQKIENLESLTLNLPSYGAGNTFANADTIKLLNRMFNSCPKITKLDLNLFEWGFYNKNLTSEPIIFLLENIAKYGK